MLVYGMTPKPQSDELALQLERSANELREAFPDIGRISRENQSIALSRMLDEAKPIEERLRNTIAKDAALAGLCSGWVSFAGIGHSIAPQALSFVLLRNVLFEGRQVPEILAEFRAFGQKRTSGGNWYGIVAGVGVTKQDELAPDLHLIPMADVPDCPQKERLTSSDYSVETYSGLRPTPNCAVRINLPERMTIFQTAMEDRSLGSQPLELTVVISRASDVVRILTAATGKPVAMLGSWAYASEAVLRQISGIAFQYGDGLDDSALFGPSLKPVALDVQSIAQAFANLEKFQGSNGETIRTALDRVNFRIASVETRRQSN